jgi:hypothetical protein
MACSSSTRQAADVVRRFDRRTSATLSASTVLSRFNNSSPTSRQPLPARVVRTGKLELTARDVSESLSVELAQRRHQPVVEPLMQQQRFDAAFTQQLQLWRAFRGREVVCADVEDLLLTIVHSRT